MVEKSPLFAKQRGDGGEYMRRRKTEDGRPKTEDRS